MVFFQSAGDCAILGLQSKASTPESDASTGELQPTDSPETQSSNGILLKPFFFKLLSVGNMFVCNKQDDDDNADDDAYGGHDVVRIGRYGHVSYILGIS